MLFNGKTTKRVYAQKSKYVDFRVLTRCVSQTTTETPSTPQLFISLEIVWIGIILLCAHSQVVYCNCVKFPQSIGLSNNEDLCLRHMDRGYRWRKGWTG